MLLPYKQPEAASLHLFSGGKHNKRRGEHEEQGEFSRSRGRLPAQAPAFAAGDTGMGCLNRSGEGARQSTAAGERESSGAEEKGWGEAGRDLQQGRHAGNRGRSCRRPCPLLPVQLRCNLLNTWFKGRLCDFVNQMNAALRLDFV
ncbi:hypothetical protein U1Q18_006423 [Sarracenia purpurea var. burkii]